MIQLHVDKLLLRAREEPLTDAERAIVDTHISACPACAALRDTLARNDRLLALREAPLPLPVRRAPRARASMWRMPVIPAGALALVVVLALVVGTSIGARRVAVPQPSGAVGGDRYGLIVQAGGPVVRSEDDPTPIAQLYQEPSHRGTQALGVSGAVSPDGRRFAYWIWDTSPPGLGSLSLMRLALYDGTTGTTRELLRLENQAGSGVAWSTDGTGLLFGVVYRVDVGAGAAANMARLRTFDLASGAIDDVGPVLGSGSKTTPDVISGAANVSIRPLLWDRPGKRVIGVTSDGNTNYANGIMVIDEGFQQHGYPLSGQFLNNIAISSDGTMIAGARTSDFALVAWPVADYGARKEIVPGPGERILSFWWRPRSDQLFFLHDNLLQGGPPGASSWNRLEVWRPGADAPRVVDPAANGGSIVFRFDGSAYFRTSFDAGAQPELIETDSGRRIGSLADAGPIVATLLLPKTAARPVTTPPASLPRPVERIPWSDGATDGLVSPDTRYVVAKLPDGLGMYKVSGGSGARRLILVKRVVVGTDGGKWLEDSSGFLFEGVYGTTRSQLRRGPLPIAFDLEVLETTGSVTHLAGNTIINTAVFSRLSPDATTLAINGPCCPQQVRLMSRAGGSSRDLLEGSLVGWDKIGRVLYTTPQGRIGARAPTSATSSYEVTVPMPADTVSIGARVTSLSPDGTAMLVQAGRRPGGDQSYFALVNGRIIQLPPAGAPMGLWIGAHELLLQQPGDKFLRAFDPTTGQLRQLLAVLDQGATLWRSSGSFLLWQLRGTFRLTDLETGAMRFVDLPADEVGGADFWVTEPGQFAIISKVGVAFIDALALMAQPAPSNLLRDRPTVGTTHVPDGFELPPLCRYVDFHDNLSSWDWQIDCGDGRNVRATIGVNLERAGWSTCKTTAAESIFVKGDREVVVTDSAGAQLPMSMTESLRQACR